MNRNVLYAVFKRNFVSYFVNPTGYVFICLFMLISSFAAFWLNDFFNANLANLDQLNKVFPFVMLVFIPAITMGVWAEERHQGTDELLLTVPASDLDIVLGKYLAAVAIYTVSLLFSLVCNYTVLQMLGDPDGGLFLGTYFGYWLVGLAMLAIGMVASFLTGNLTVAYVLGAVFNVPLVFATPEVLTVAIRAVISVPNQIVAGLDKLLLAISENWTLLSGVHHQLEDAAVNVPSRLAMQVQHWGIGGQFAGFGRGVVSFSGIVYFVAIAAVMLYLSMVLIGRRHWRSGQARASALVPYADLLYMACTGVFGGLLWLCLWLFHSPVSFSVVVAITLAFYLPTILVAVLVRMPINVAASLLYPLLQIACILVSLFLAISLVAHYSPLAVAVIVIGLYFLVQVDILLALSVGQLEVSLLPGHYITRTLALAAAGIGVTLFFGQHDLVRWDVTSEGLNSLSKATVELLEGLEPQRPVQIEAFISPEHEIPESFIETRLNLLNQLREIQASGGEKIKLQILDTERFSDEASRADERYGITSRRVNTRERGVLRRDNIFMGVAFTSGLEKVMVPFVNRGTPVEYELVRSIATVTSQKRKTVGVLHTDADLMSRSGGWPIIDELKKQYDVEEVPADGLGAYDYTLRRQQRKPLEKRAGEIREKLKGLGADQKQQADKLRKELKEIEGKLDGDLKVYDVILAVQPSSLGPEQMKPFLAAIRSGQPTAIFEDPCPGFAQRVPATSQPRYPPAGMNPMMMMGQRSPPKGNIKPLWDLLGVDFFTDKVVWQSYNPYPMIRWFGRQKELVFVGKGSGAEEPFNDENEISKKLQNALFPFPGSISKPDPSELKRGDPKLDAKDLEFNELVRTSNEAGAVNYRDLVQMNPFGPPMIRDDLRRKKPSGSYVLAAQIRGKLKNRVRMTAEDEEEASEPELNVVLVADIDMLTPAFFALREEGQIEELGISLDFDNVTFVLNILDELAGDPEFIAIRRHRPMHRPLVRIEEATKEAREETDKAREAAYDKFEKDKEKEQKAFSKKIDNLKKRKDVDDRQMAIEVTLAMRDGQQRLDARLKEAQQELSQETNRIETRLGRQRRQVQDGYKMWAVLLPPIPPLLLGLGVLLARRAAEREGVSRSRLKP